MVSKARLTLFVLLVIHSGLLAWLARVHSPNLNEPAHLVAGLSHWEHGSFTLYRVNPPLVRMVAAVPVWLHGYTADWSGYHEGLRARPVFRMGEMFVAANGQDTFRLITLARLACIPFSLIGLVVCFLWGRDLFGPAAGIMAATLWCFSPMVLGHSAMFTPDAHSAALGLAACYTFWRWLKDPTWRQAVLTGLVLGIAELSKTTLIIFYPLWPLLWIVYRWPDRLQMSWLRWRDEAGMLLLRMAIGLYVLNLGYLADGTFTPLKEYQFVSEWFAGTMEERRQASADGLRTPHNRFADRWWASIPLPFPKDYLLGIDIQQRDFEDFSRPSYLRGRFQPQGWWYYYLYAIAVKAPLGTLGLGLLAIAVAGSPLRSRLPWRDWMILLMPALIIFAIASMKYGFSHHSRYILPCIPLVFIAISSLGRQVRLLVVRLARVRLGKNRCHQLQPLGRRQRRRQRQHAVVGLLAVLLLLASVGSSLRVFPHCVGYFHELVGGPAGGPAHLINSNVDWGQDLLFLRNWIESQPDLVKAPADSDMDSDMDGGADSDVDRSRSRPVFLAFDNYYNPFVLGIRQLQPWPFRDQQAVQSESIADGYYAISVNQLYEHPWPLRDAQGGYYRIDSRPLSALRTQAPIARAGYSIWIYSGDQLRDAYAGLD